MAAPHVLEASVLGQHVTRPVPPWAPIVTGGPATYAAILRDTYGAAEVWPLVDVAAGTTIAALVDPARNGTLTGWDLQDAAGPVAGSLAPYNGVGDVGDLRSAALNSLFDGDQASLFGWARIGHADWSQPANDEYLLHLYGNSQNELLIYRYSLAANQLTFVHAGSGTRKTIQHNGITTLDWFSFALTADAGQLKAYVDGAQAGTTQDGLGAWAAATFTYASLGAWAASPGQGWQGWLAYLALKIGTAWTPAQILAMHNLAATAPPD